MSSSGPAPLAAFVPAAGSLPLEVVRLGRAAARLSLVDLNHSALRRSSRVPAAARAAARPARPGKRCWRHSADRERRPAARVL